MALLNPADEAILKKLKGRGKARGVHRMGEMNKLEAEYASELQIKKNIGEISDFKFEAVTLRLAPKTTYTPDFMVMLPSGLIQFHEVKIKGVIWEDSIVKIKVAAEMFPFTFILAKRVPEGWSFTRYE